MPWGLLLLDARECLKSQQFARAWRLRCCLSPREPPGTFGASGRPRGLRARALGGSREGAWSCGSHLGPWALKALREARAGGQRCRPEPLEGQVRGASGPGFLRGHRAWPGSGSAVVAARSLRPPRSGSASLSRWEAEAAGRGEGLCPLPSNLPQYFCSSARCPNPSPGILGC